jgi:transposase
MLFGAWLSDEESRTLSALSADLRERVVVAIECGASRHEAAHRFEASSASATRWHAAYLHGGAGMPCRLAATSAPRPPRDEPT